MSDLSPPQGRRVDPAAFRTATLLVATGDRGMRRAMRDILLGMGFPNILTAGTAAEMFRTLTEQQPTVLLLDLKLPGSEGLALTRRLRRDRGDIGRTPIILMADAPDLALVAAARDAGVNEIVVKPPAVGALVLRLMHVLKAPRAFIDTPVYAGPDRRRLADRRRQERRQSEPRPPGEERRGKPPTRRQRERRRKEP